MTIYFITLAIFAVLSLNRRSVRIYQNGTISYQQIYYIFTVVWMTLLMGLRSSTVGIDTIQYENRYNNFEYMLNSSRYASEAGFNIFNYIFNKLGFSFQMYLVVVSLILMVLLLSFFKSSKNQFFSIYIFITIGVFVMFMSGMRQSLAVVFCLTSLKFINDKKFIRAILLIALAISFHNSAFIFVIMLLLYKIRLSKKQVAIMLLIASASLFYWRLIIGIMPYFMPVRYTDYALEIGYQMNNLLLVVAIAIPVFCLVMNVRDIEEDGKFNHMTSLLFCMSAFNILFTIMAMSSNQIGRLAYYFVNANSILIPNTLEGINDKRIKIIFYYTIAAFCLLYFILSVPGGTLKIDQYKFFWNR